MCCMPSYVQDLKAVKENPSEQSMVDDKSVSKAFATTKKFVNLISSLVNRLSSLR